MAEQRQVPFPGMESPVTGPPTPTASDADGGRPGFKRRVFGSEGFFQLWLTQVASSIGDWLGFFAIAALAARIGGEDSAAAAIGVVMAARIAPGFFLGAASGVIADRFDRKKVMVYCNLGRAAVLVLLPFVDTILQLVLASLLLECFTLLWTPAKEASVPNLVPAEHLTTANSLSLVAAYGTMPLAAGLFSLLAGVSDVLGRIDLLDALSTNDESLAFYVNAATFLLSAVMISRLTLPKQERRPATSDRRIDFGGAFHDLKEGWRFIFINPVVRAVNVGLATGLIGGGMLVPLGPVFSSRVLDAGTAGFGIFIFALGCGVAVGVILLSIFQRHIPKARIFAASVFGAGASLIVAASMSSLGLAALFVSLLGVCAGSVYVLGFTLLHESVDDELRGRIFSALYTLVRLCVLIAFAVGPLLSDLLDRLSRQLFDRAISLFGFEIAIPGVRLTLWLAGLIIMGAGVLAVLSLRAGREAAKQGSSTLDELLLHEGAELVAGLAAPFAEVKGSHAKAGEGAPAPPSRPTIVPVADHHADDADGHEGDPNPGARP
jgi:dTMP kinase